jgi:hypothetical protein
VSASTTGDNSLALGAFLSDGGFANSVALGTSTTATADNQVNVGARTIGGLAAGVAADDAVNLAQMQAADAPLQSQIAANGGEIAALEASDAQQDADIIALQGANADSLYVEVNSVGTAASATGVDGIAIGVNSVADGDLSIAIGQFDKCRL